MPSKITVNNFDAFKRQVHAEQLRRLEAAATVVESRAKVLLSVAGTGVKRAGVTVAKVKGMRGKTIYGAFPSKPGEPPRKQTGRLRASVTHEVLSFLMVARTGTNVFYGRILELFRQRYWLVRAFRESMPRIRAIFDRPFTFR